MVDSTNNTAEPRTFDFPQYAFHNPEFVEWWLGSLYLLPTVDQIAVAEILEQSIHNPQVKEVLRLFILNLDVEFKGQDFADGSVQVDDVPAFEGTLAERSIQFAKYHVFAYWRSNPWMVIISGAGLLFAVGRGIWFVGKEFFRIVF